MKTLFCCMEVEPFSKVGGLADVCSALPKALSSQGVETAIITPFHKVISRKDFSLQSLPPETKTVVSVGSDEIPIEFFKADLDDINDIPVYFVFNEHLFNRDGVYINPSSGKEYTDNPKRYIALSKAILEFVRMGIFSPDIFHLHDHHTAIIPAIAKSLHRDHPVIGKAKFMLTIHNIAYQGDCGLNHARLAGIDEKMIESVAREENTEGFNFLKWGIRFADKVNTVSQTYADETRNNEELGYGLSKTLIDKGDDYFGIQNGVDYNEWNPLTDKYIDKNYGEMSLKNKYQNKYMLLKSNGLDYSQTDWPTIGMITRLVNHKGIDLLVQIIEKLLTWDLHLILLGTGDHRYHKLFEQIKMRFPHKFGLNLTFSNKMAHEIEAGSDFFLIPSRYEPCGLNQLYSMKYGTIPIVRKTGGLADTVKDYNEETDEGWGFVFEEYDSQEFLKTIWRAITIYKQPKKFKGIVKRAMMLDFSWNESAKSYKKVYESLLE